MLLHVPTAVVLLAWAAGPALAQEALVGDAAAGEKKMAGICAGGCHLVENEDGEIVVGRRGPIQRGPNLFDVVGRQPGSVPGFEYSPLMQAYVPIAVPWDEEHFVAYVMDPTGFLKEATGEDSYSLMPTGLVYSEQEAHDVWAYLMSLHAAQGGPVAGMASE
jgi:cytochrome c